MARNKKQGDKFNTPFATSLRQLIEDRKVTQGDIASVTGVTRQTVSQYCNGISEPGYDTLVTIADYFNVSTDYLLGIKKDPSRLPCATDDLRLSTATIDMIHSLSATERVGFEKMASSDLLKVLCGQLAAYNELPPYFSPRYELLTEYREADSSQNNIEKMIINVHPEMQGRFSVLCGVRYAEYLKQQILETLGMMLNQIDFEKGN